jgi:hypothetical protein
MSAERSRRAIATFRQRIGEAAFAEHMRSLRAKRRDFGKPFRLDYVDKQGRTGSEIAAAAGRRGGKMRISKHKQENQISEQNQNQQNAGH